MLVTLGEREIKTLEDFADLASDELTDPQEGILREYGLGEDGANDIIMTARVAAGWFTEEELAAAKAEAEAAAAAAEAEEGEGDAGEAGEAAEASAPPQSA